MAENDKLEASRKKGFGAWRVIRVKLMKFVKFLSDFARQENEELGAEG
jgi:hypothetical protein